MLQSFKSKVHAIILTSASMHSRQITFFAKMDEPIDIPNPFQENEQQCILCKHNITPDYKNVKLLSQFQSPYTGRVYSRHITGLCKQKQLEVNNAIVRAQSCVMMPSYHKDFDFLKDSKLFNVEKPIRPHKH